jgi:tetratricopeptide (TPR) repeat protein
VIDGNNYQQAIAFLNSVLSTNPRDAEALYYRGRCWHYSNQYRRAIQDLNTSLELDPRNSWAYLYRGRVLLGMNANKSQIEAEFTRAIQVDSNNVDAYFARANLYAQAFTTKDLEAYKRSHKRHCVQSTLYPSLRPQSGDRARPQPDPNGAGGFGPSESD